MATPEQIEKMLEVMSQQMMGMQTLQNENRALLERNRELQLAGNATQATPEHKTKRSPPKRPTIEANIDDSDWVLFTDSWGRYKRMAQITSNQDLILELRASCSDEVNKMLFQFTGPAKLSDPNLTEAALLAMIKTVAVKGTHEEVHRLTFGKLTQAAGETITQFVARLRAQSLLCNFQVTCSCGIVNSYAENRVAERLVAGTKNQSHQAQVLSEADTLKTIEKKIDRLVALEVADNASGSFREADSSGAAAIKWKNNQGPKSKARDRRDDKKDEKTPPRRIRPCRGCGKTSHGPTKTLSRKDCPYYDKKCTKCQFMGHDASVCERSKSRAAQGRDDAPLDDYEGPPVTASTSFAFASNSDFRLSPEQKTLK